MKIILITSALLLSACSGTKPTNLGIQNNSLSECIDRTNCVSSMTTVSGNHIQPIAYSGNDFGSVVLNAVDSFPRLKIITKQDNYIYLQQSSFLFRFVDDIELWHQKENNLIQIRSASRVGKSDFGVNRKRLEKLRSILGSKP